MTFHSNFFNRSDWLNSVADVFNLRQSKFEFQIINRNFMLDIQEDDYFVYANFIGYTNFGLDSISDSELSRLIKEIEFKYGKKLRRMKLFPLVKIDGHEHEFSVASTLVIDLTKKSLYKKEVKYEINKALRTGVTVKEISADNLIQFYKVYLDTARRVNSSYVTPIRLFEKIINLDKCFISCAFFENKIIAGSVYLCDGIGAYYWWNASNELGRKYSANYLITACVIEKLKSRGVEFLDLASSNNEYVERAKKMWNPDKTNYYEYYFE